MGELRLSAEPHGADVVVAVRGDLDVVTSQRFDDYLSDAGGGAAGIVLDLSGVDFMDTTALAVIVGHWRRQTEAGGRFLLAGARYRYARALWITGLADRLPMYGSVGEALDALAAARPSPGAETGHDAREPD